MSLHPNINSQPNSEFYGCSIIGIVLLVLFLLASIASHDPPNGLVEESRIRGAEAGKEDGLKAGEADAVRSRRQTAYDESYSKTIDEAKTSGDYVLVPMYCFVIALACASVGYAIQFSAFYVLRRTGVLQDVDKILLPPGSTVADLEIPPND